MTVSSTLCNDHPESQESGNRRKRDEVLHVGKKKGLSSSRVDDHCQCIPQCLLLSARERQTSSLGTLSAKRRGSKRKNLLPEGILHRFQDGSYQAQIVTLPATAAWGSKFNSASETNAGKFEIDASGSLVTKGTNTVPPFLYGYPFPQIDPKDPQAASKVINNFSYALMQADDVDRSSSLTWVTPTAVQNHVEFQTQLLFHGSRFSGPIANPDATLRKGIIAGLSPAEIYGVMILEWVYLDPQRWNSLWMYAPELRRVRQLPPFNGSDSLFGSDLAHDDPYLFSGKVQYFTWKLVSTQEALVPYVPSRPNVLRPRKFRLRIRRTKSTSCHGVGTGRMERKSLVADLHSTCQTACMGD